MSANPFVVTRCDDGDTKETSFTLSSIETPIPDELSLMLGDSVHCARSALDHLACALTANVKAAFPVWTRPSKPSPEEMLTFVLDRKNMPSAPRDLASCVAAIEPYACGAGKYIHALHVLDIHDKHRLLLTVQAAQSSISMARPYDGDPASLTSPLGFDFGDAGALGEPVEVGQVLYRCPTPVRGDVDVDVSVAFGEPELLNGRPLTPWLSTLIDEAERVVNLLAAQE